MSLTFESGRLDMNVFLWMCSSVPSKSRLCLALVHDILYVVTAAM